MVSKEFCKKKSFSTRIIHEGHSVDPVTHSLANPIFQTATFGFSKVEEMDRAWDELGYLYTREGNPSVLALEEKLAWMEGAKAALAAASGMGAICSTFLSLLKKGDHILCSNGLFFHSDIFIRELLENMGVEISFVSFNCMEDVERSIKNNTSIIFVETPANPVLDIVDISEVSKLAKKKGCIFIVDSTFAPPPIQFPLDYGADLVVHSLTKYINGHGDTLGGAVIGSKDLIDKIRYPGLPCFTGASLSPFSAWLIMRGMMTLEMRVERHCLNAQKVAQFLELQDEVEKVIYPSLRSHPQYELCERQMNGRGGGIVSFYLKNNIGGRSVRQADYEFCNSLKLITIATSLGEGHALIQVENSDMIRIAVGLENHEDIIFDLKQAFDVLKGV